MLVPRLLGSAQFVSYNNEPARADIFLRKNYGGDPHSKEPLY
jgi:hypothetical protein